MASEGFRRFAAQDDSGLYLVSPTDQSASCNCDIFIVHGFHGGPTKTWQHPESGHIWFRDFLPQRIRQKYGRDAARIWTYGYPATEFRQTATLSDFARLLLYNVGEATRTCHNRKIVWICHSFGGLVVKEALVQAQMTAEFKRIRENTTGIIFLGTPHQGSSAADLGHVAASIVRSATAGIRIMNPGIIRDLRRNNERLLELSMNFASLCGDENNRIIIHSFHETIPLGPAIIVNRHSALMNCANEKTRCPLMENHKDMAKFKDPYDSNWISFVPSVMQLVDVSCVRQVYQAPPPQPRPSVQPQRPPYPQQDTFPMTQNMRNGFNQGGQPSYPQADYQAYQPRPQPQPQQHYSQPGPAPGLRASRPYPSVRPEFSREDLRPPAATQSQASALPSSTTRGPDPADDDLQSGRFSALCDSCMNPIRCTQARVQCTVCYDYDLCVPCFQRGKTTKGHKGDHTVSHVMCSQRVYPEDLTPVLETANPENHADNDMVRQNWTVKERDRDGEKVEVRWSHIHGTDSHARFLLLCKPGNFAVNISLEVEWASNIAEAGRRQLQQSGAGCIRISLGTVKHKPAFFNSSYTDETFRGKQITNNSLPHLLLNPGFVWDVTRIQLDQNDISMVSDSILTVAGQPGSSQYLGLIVQWSGCPSFASSANPIMSILLNSIRLDDLLDYREPYVRAKPPMAAPSPVPPRQTPSPAPSSSPSAAANPQGGDNDNDDDDDDDDDVVTVEEFVALMVQAHREQQNNRERAILQAALQERLRQQEAAKQALIERAFKEALEEYVQEQQERQRRAIEAARARAALEALLQGFSRM